MADVIPFRDRVVGHPQDRQRPRPAYDPRVVDLASLLEVLQDTDGDGPDDFELRVRELLDELGDLLVSKQRDYGPHAISRSPGGAIHGINVRMHDKLARAIHLLERGAQPGNESLTDTYRDLANYAVIAVMVLEGSWPQ